MLKEVKKETKKIDIKAVMALCDIQDDFDSFNQEIKKIMTSSDSTIDIYRLYRISMGEKIKGVKENENLIKFYLQNEEVITKIKKNCSINDFISNNYTQEGNISDTSCIKELHEYLNKHKNNKEQILKLLNKLNNLGFSSIIFDEELDFTDEKYSINDIFNRNEEVVYLDNIDVVPNYDFGVVDYRTKNSNYKMILKTLCFDFSRSNRTIALNSLLFNIDELPKKIDKETIFDSIINLKKEKKNECKKITNSVDLSVKIDDFYDQFALLNESVDKLDTMTSTKEIKDVLKNIKELIDELKNRSCEYDSNLSKTEENITLEGLKKEKIKFLERRTWKKENCC